MHLLMTRHKALPAAALRATSSTVISKANDLTMLSLSGIDTVNLRTALV